MSKRRKRPHGRPKRRDGLASPAAEPPAPPARSELEQLQASLAALAPFSAIRCDAAAAPDVPPRPPGLVARFTRWRRRRQQRALLAKFDRAIARRQRDPGDHASAALLALVTESVARVTALGHRDTDLAEAVTMARRVLDDYLAYLAQLARVRDHDAREAVRWRERADTARLATCEDLATAADERVVVWERRRDDAVKLHAACEAGRHRLEDAVAQLEALAQRSQTAHK